MLENEADLIAQIRHHVPAFKTVGNPSIVNDEQNIGRLLPLCLVVPGESTIDTPKEPDWRASAPVTERRRWDVLIFVEHQNSESTDGLTEAEAGKLMKAVFDCVHGLKTKRESKEAGFIYSGCDAPLYQLGWARFPLVFHARTQLSNFEFKRPEFFQDYEDARLKNRD